MTESTTRAEDEATRSAILAAMARLLAGTALRSTGRLSVSQLAIEAGIKRWQLTHRHIDLKEQFQAEVKAAAAAQTVKCRCGSDYLQLRVKHATLLEQVADLEQRLRQYAMVINTLATENATLAGRTGHTARVVALPRPDNSP
ncbi:hypothetical protein AB4305_31340 [Nocardia sp. 2YAB30]|uniref:hypothetical protein n=1 Tax=unclassified Nocardia TaxID=2637762 RepID=UPI003F985CF2